jgi:hypothetical protein
MLMSKKQDFLQRACDLLGLQIQFNCKIKLTSGSEVVVEAVISQPNNRFKMYVFEKIPAISDLSVITDEGNGFTSFGNPRDAEKFDIKSYADMFKEWEFIF